MPHPLPNDLSAHWEEFTRLLTEGNEANDPLLRAERMWEPLQACTRLADDAFKREHFDLMMDLSVRSIQKMQQRFIQEEELTKEQKRLERESDRLEREVDELEREFRRLCPDGLPPRTDEDDDALNERIETQLSPLLAAIAEKKRRIVTDLPSARFQITLECAKLAEQAKFYDQFSTECLKWM